VTLVGAAFAAAALAAGALTIAADDRGKRPLVYVFKPLALLLLIALAALARSAAPPGSLEPGAPALRVSPAYKTFVLTGLGLSLAGDIFMMLRRKRFELGLAAFLGAHICYIAAFRTDMLPRFAAQPAFPLVIIAALILRVLLPHLGRMKYPVLLYVLIITAMAAMAAGRFIQWGGEKPLFAFAGAALFMVSDAVLAFDRFVRPVRRAQMAILATYFVAQTLIALSV
jgi:uncharacterized membrane protein YhhN